MSAALKLEPRPPKWSVQDYLEAEKTSGVRHEYVGGNLYAMAGASEDLQEYVLVEQGSMIVTVHRRSKAWIPDVLTGADALLELSSIGFSMPLSQIYEGVF